MIHEFRWTAILTLSWYFICFADLAYCTSDYSRNRTMLFYLTSQSVIYLTSKERERRRYTFQSPYCETHQMVWYVEHPNIFNINISERHLYGWYWKIASYCDCSTYFVIRETELKWLTSARTLKRLSLKIKHICNDQKLTVINTYRSYHRSLLQLHLELYYLFIFYISFQLLTAINITWFTGFYYCFPTIMCKKWQRSCMSLVLLFVDDLTDCNDLIIVITESWFWSGAVILHYNYYFEYLTVFEICWIL